MQAVRQDHRATWQKRYWPVKTRFLIRNQTVRLKSEIHEMALCQSGAPAHRTNEKLDFTAGILTGAENSLPPVSDIDDAEVVND